MLIEKNSTEIVSISIAGGLEILGRLTDEEGELHIENAMALAQTPQGIAIVKWPNSGNNKKVWMSHSDYINPSDNDSRLITVGDRREILVMIAN